MSEIEKRLARGERGIPKIPDSPDTRHAQAQQPRPDLRALLKETLPQLRWTNSNGSCCDELIAEIESALAAPQPQLCMICDKPCDEHAAGPAEQPAPPPVRPPWFDVATSTWYVWDENGPMQRVQVLCPTCKRVKCSIHADATVAEPAQPSAPPQAAADCPNPVAFKVHFKGLYADHDSCAEHRLAWRELQDFSHDEPYTNPRAFCCWTEKHIGSAAEPSVEARQLGIEIERAALTKLVALAADPKILNIVSTAFLDLRVSKEQQNG